MKKLLSICLKGFLVLIASMFLMQGVARAHLYGVSYGDPNLYISDDIAGGGLPHYAHSADASECYYGCILSRLYSIDPNTALWTGIGDLIKGSGTASISGYWGVQGIDFDPNNGKLYGVGYQCSDPNANAPYLIGINPCSGAVLTEQAISTSGLPNWVRFTDISFNTDRVLYAFYSYSSSVGQVDPNVTGHLATISMGGTATRVGTAGTGSGHMLGGGMSFMYDDPNVLYEAETKENATSGSLNLLNHYTGVFTSSTGLTFSSPITATALMPIIYSMDSKPSATGTLYATVHIQDFTDGSSWACNNYLAKITTAGVVNVIGCLWGDFPEDTNPYTNPVYPTYDFLPYHEIQAIAWAPLPRANAGVDFSVQQSSWDGGVVTLDGSGSKDYINCYDMSYIWSWTDTNSVAQALYGKTPASVLPLGAHEITLTVDTGNGTATDTVIATVQDTMKPVINCLANIVVEQETLFGTLVDPTPPDVSDNCDPNVTVTGVADPNHPLPYLFPLGTTNVIWTATDVSGNTATCTQSVTVVDTTPPTIYSVSTDPNTLTPGMCGSAPLKGVTVQVYALDICDLIPTSKIISVTSNQTASRYSFFTEPDWFITGTNTVLLRAKSNLLSTVNRIYTITVESTDSSGNSSTATTTVEIKYTWSSSWSPFIDPNSSFLSRDRNFLNRDRPSFRDRNRRLPR